MARRELLRHRLRTAVLVVLVALPIAVAVIASTAAGTKDYRSENSLYSRYGTADARLDVTQWPRVRNHGEDAGGEAFWDRARGLTRTDRRDPADVDVSTLLPAGSTVTQVGYAARARLATGGTLDAQVLDLSAPLTRGLDRVVQGRAPTAVDETAVNPVVADELGLLVEDTLREGATLDLVGHRLHVVGLVDTADQYDTNVLVVPPGSLLGTSRRDGVGYLVDLPTTSAADGLALREELARAGVASDFRDAARHPEAWGAQPPAATPVDPVALAVGALVIGLGLVEVLVLVGAAFAVSARAQSRVLGLVMASGGTPGDVRRTVLAQGVLIGVAAAVLGVGLAALGLVTGRRPIGDIMHVDVYDWSISVGTIIAVAVLGVVSSVLAAATPAWGVGRMTASQALDGHVASAPAARPSHDRFRAPALGLVSVGLVGLVGCGFWTAHSFAATDDATVTPSSPIPVVLGALFALTLLGGVVLGTPVLVTWAGRATSRGWLPWRLAARDATRHRARTSAAVLAIGVVTTGAVFAGLGVSAANASGANGYSEMPPGFAEIYLDGGGDALPRVADTIREVTGAEHVVSLDVAHVEGREVVSRGYNVAVVDADLLADAGVDARGRAAFADGSVLVSESAGLPRGSVPLVGRGRPETKVRVPAFTTSLPWDGIVVWMSPEAAAQLGYEVRPSTQVWAYGSEPISDTAMDRLALYGIQGYVDSRTLAPAYVYAGALGALALTALVVGLIVSLSAAESRSDTATLSAVGAPPWIRRAMSASHAALVGSLGGLLGLGLGGAVGASLLQVTGAPGTPVPWAALGLLVVGVPALSAAVGWVVAPGRLVLTRRAG